MNDVVMFHEAKVGDLAYTYEDDAGLTDFAWVTDLEYFEERWGEIRLVRKKWMLIEVDEIVLPDPYPIEEDDDDATSAGV